MIKGHDKIRQELERAVSRDAIAGAYLFAGPEGVGKFSLALEFADRINDPDRNDPDRMIVRPAREETKGITKTGRIGIEEIRELQKHLALSASDGKWRIGIVDEAERLTKPAQNALLKTMEEPSGRSAIILVANDPRKLLPTIVSRCWRENFRLLPDESVRSILKERVSVFPEEAVRLSFGRPGWAIRLASDKDFLDSMKESESDLAVAIGRDLNAGFDLAERMAKDREQAIRTLSVWTALLGREAVGTGCGRIPKPKALEAIGSIERTVGLLGDTNANARLALENLFLETSR